MSNHEPTATFRERHHDLEFFVVPRITYSRVLLSGLRHGYPYYDQVTHMGLGATLGFQQRQFAGCARSTLGGLLEAPTVSLGQVPQGLADERQFRILLLRLDDLEEGAQGMVHQLVGVPVTVRFVVFHLPPSVHGNTGGE